MAKRQKAAGGADAFTPRLLCLQPSLARRMHSCLRLRLAYCGAAHCYARISDCTFRAHAALVPYRTATHRARAAPHPSYHHTHLARAAPRPLVAAGTFHQATGRGAWRTAALTLRLSLSLSQPLAHSNMGGR